MTDMQVELPRVDNPIHSHFVELIHSWNLNPCKRNPSSGVAAVDELSQERGISLFSFTSKDDREDFLDFYGLNDFVIHKKNVGHYWVTLTNSFAQDDVDQFMATYGSAMDTIAQIQNERVTSIRNNGNRVGFICADTFTWRETFELSRIRAARELLAASGLHFNEGGK